MKITVTQQVLGGEVEKSVILDDPERTSLAPAAKKDVSTVAARKASSFEASLAPPAPEITNGKPGQGAGKAKKEQVTDGK